MLFPLTKHNFCFFYLFNGANSLFLGFPQFKGFFESNFLPFQFFLLDKFEENKNLFSRTTEKTAPTHFNEKSSLFAREPH